METVVAAKADRSLSGIELFAGMPADALAAIQKQCRWVDVGSKQIAVDNDGEASPVVFVASGTICVFGATKNGERKEIGQVPTGGLFGDLCGINGGKLSAALGDGESGLIAILSGEAFRSVLMDHPPIAIRHIESLAQGAKSKASAPAQSDGLSPRQRVFAELIQLAVPNPVGDGSWLIDKVPNHDEIASKSGTEKTEVAMAIGTLARDGIIERKHRTLVIRDHPRLTMLANMQ